MNKTFTFDKQQYTYETGAHNNARLNERAVEVPIAAKLASSYSNVLEVGNVLSHYVPDFMHTVVDMGDYGKEIHTTDILLFTPGELFNCAISVSTLEHMANVDHAIKAIEHIKSLLEPGSPYLFTIPYGWRDEFDEAVLNRMFPVETIHRLNKIDIEKHTWKQVSLRGIKNYDDSLLNYNGQSKWANTVFILSGYTPNDSDDDNWDLVAEDFRYDER